MIARMAGRCSVFIKVQQELGALIPFFNFGNSLRVFNMKSPLTQILKNLLLVFS